MMYEADEAKREAWIASIDAVAASHAALTAPRGGGFIRVRGPVGEDEAVPARGRRTGICLSG